MASRTTNPEWSGDYETWDEAKSAALKLFRDGRTYHADLYRAYRVSEPYPHWESDRIACFSAFQDGTIGCDYTSEAAHWGIHEPGFIDQTGKRSLAGQEHAARRP